MPILSLITIPKLFDAHIHFRQGEATNLLVPYTARCCTYTTVMPNTDPPITRPDQLIAYRKSIMKAAAAYPNFKPLFMAYLTETTTKEDVQAMAAAGAVGYKIYPKNKGRNGTTGSKHGIPLECFLDPPASLLAALDEIPAQKLITSCHAEWPDTYFMESEIAFLESDFMKALVMSRHKIIVEHICSADGIDWVRYTRHKYAAQIAGSITLHHLFMTTDDVLGQNDNFCRPPAHSPEDLEALRRAVIWNEGDVFFMGSDSAWHPWTSKHTAQACAGCFTAPALVEHLVDFFDQRQSFPSPIFDNFVRGNACKFYGVPLPTETITLEKKIWQLDERINLKGVTFATPWWHHEKLAWKLKE